MKCEFCRNDNADSQILSSGAQLTLCPGCRKAVEGLHSHLDPVLLPGGSVVTAASYFSGYQRTSPPDFGLYLDVRWEPPWPHAHTAWPDFGVPSEPDLLTAPLSDLLRRAQENQVVEVGCLGGHGRTGTALGCLAVLSGVPASEAVTWVRANYCPLAVETDGQASFVEQFAPT